MFHLFEKNFVHWRGGEERMQINSVCLESKLYSKEDTFSVISYRQLTRQYSYRHWIMELSMYTNLISLRLPQFKPSMANLTRVSYNDLLTMTKNLMFLIFFLLSHFCIQIARNKFSSGNHFLQHMVVGNVSEMFLQCGFWCDAEDNSSAAFKVKATNK